MVQLQQALDNGYCAMGLFIDLKKAFDTVPHELLLLKLECYGVRGVALSWFRSYLSGRKQCVRENNAVSGFLEITCGVPQGSILGPLLFMIYINDLGNVGFKGRVILYADDTNFLYCDRNAEEILPMAQADLNSLQIWCQINKLTVNSTKSLYMFIAKPNVCIESDMQLICIRVYLSKEWRR